jgi:hypothetical protein
MQEQEKKEEHSHDENELVAEPIPESGNSPESSDVDDSHKPADDGGNPRQRRIGGTTRIPPKQRPSG